MTVHPRIKVGLAACWIAAMGQAQVTLLASRNSNDESANQSSTQPTYSERTISADGRFVAFMSCATNLVPGDTNATWDVFVRDVLNGRTERISISSAGAQCNGISGLYGIAISPDGRFVAFESAANNLVPGDTNGAREIFLRDRKRGLTERVSVGLGGIQANAGCLQPSMSSDGRYVAFTTDADNLVPGDTNGTFDTFVRDRIAQIAERVSVTTAGIQGNAGSYKPSVSGDGRFIVFDSLASNLDPTDTNSAWDVFVHDRVNGTTERVSVSTGGAQGSRDSWASSISEDGRFVVFTSMASELVLGDSNGTEDVFVRDLLNATTERVSLTTSGAEGNGSSGGCSISADGRFVAFASYATNLVPGDVNQQVDSFVRDRRNGTTVLVSVSTASTQGNGTSLGASLSGDGRFVAFSSFADNLVPGDINGEEDIFVHDLDSSGFTVACEPGLQGVIPCPCSNPPSNAGAGCENSAATGGAVLSASGIAYLSMDSLVFTTAGELSTALSIVVQGPSTSPNGIAYGQGVRCVNGSLKRLFAKSASSGSIRAPDFVSGDPSVSRRSRALGDLIQPGDSRWYLVYYRDPNVLGRCGGSSTFNATPTARVSWRP